MSTWGWKQNALVTVDLAQELSRRLGVPLQQVVIDGAGKSFEAVKSAATPPLIKSGDTGEAGDVGEAGALDLEAAAVADEAGEPPQLVIPDRLIVEGVERQ